MNSAEVHREHKTQHQEENETNVNESSSQLTRPSTKIILIASAVLLALILFTTYIIIPAQKGYSVYNTMHQYGVPDEYINNITALHEAKTQAELQANISAQRIVELQQTMQKNDAQFATYINTTDTKIHEYEQTIAKTKADLQTAQTQLAALSVQGALDQKTIESTANRLCCIARITNPVVNAYLIQGSSVACVSEGGTKISC